MFAYPQNSNAKVSISGNTNLKDGENEITIGVTSANGLANRKYKIKIDKTNTVAISNTDSISTESNEQSMSNDSMSNHPELRTFLTTTIVTIIILIVIIFVTKRKQ